MILPFAISILPSPTCCSRLLISELSGICFSWRTQPNPQALTIGATLTSNIPPVFFQTSFETVKNSSVRLSREFVSLRFMREMSEVLS